MRRKNRELVDERGGDLGQVNSRIEI